MSLNSFFFTLNKCSEILKLNQEFLNKEKFYDFVIFDQNHEVPKLISFSIVKFCSRNSHIKINSFKMSGLCLRSVFILNRKIEPLYISGSECAGTCQPALTEIQPINFIRCLKINVRACTNTRIWNFEIFFMKRWSRFLKDWNLGEVRKIPLSLSRIATRRSSGYSFLIKLQLLSVIILLGKLHFQFLEVLRKSFVIEYIFSKVEALTLQEWFLK